MTFEMSSARKLIAFKEKSPGCEIFSHRFLRFPVVPNSLDKIAKNRKSTNTTAETNFQYRNKSFSSKETSALAIRE